jgi:hypothetical protein
VQRLVEPALQNCHVLALQGLGVGDLEGDLFHVPVSRLGISTFPADTDVGGEVGLLISAGEQLDRRHVAFGQTGSRERQPDPHLFVDPVDALAVPGDAG